MATPMPVLDESFDHTIIIGGLPIVDPAKSAKLIAFIKSKFADFQPLNVELPMVEDKSLGFMFVECGSADLAKKALSMNGKPMDRQHNFKVDLFSTPDQYLNTPDEYVEPTADDILKGPAVDKYEFLLDSDFRDQILVRFEDENNFHHTHVNYVDLHNDNILVESWTAANMTKQGKPLTTNLSGFSPKGTYMYTIHGPGVALWVGNDFQRVASLQHPQVQKIAFSPCERYLVTMSEQPDPSPLCDVVVWNVETQAPVVRYNTILKGQAWPLLKWSHDGRYFGRTANRKVDNKDGTSSFTPIGVAVYDTEKGEIVTGKPIPAPGIVDFQWSPTQPLLAFATISNNQVPSRMVVYDIEKKRELRNNPSFGVERWELVWQDTGDVLCAYMDRKTDKRNTIHALDLYFVKAKNCPLVEHLLPKPASKLTISPRQHKIVVTSFRINDKGVSKAEFTVFSFTENAINQLWSETIPFPTGVNTDKPADYQKAFPVLWSPQGDTFIIGTIAPLNANLLVMDAAKDSIEILAADLQLAHGNSIKWDYSGRFFVLSSTRDLPTRANKNSEDWKSAIHSRFQIYNFQGKLLAERKVPRLYNIEFRPFPLTNLTPQEQGKVRQALKTDYWKKYENQDDRFEKAKLGDATAARNDLKNRWKSLKKSLREKYAASAADRRDLYGGWCTDDEDEYEVVELSRTSKLIH